MLIFLTMTMRVFDRYTSDTPLGRWPTHRRPRAKLPQIKLTAPICNTKGNTSKLSSISILFQQKKFKFFGSILDSF